MLAVEVVNYLRRRADKRPSRLLNFVSAQNDHSGKIWEPRVSIIIPTRDKFEFLSPCINSICSLTNYKNFEIVVIDNGSTDAKALEYLDSLSLTNIKVLKFPYKFNFSEICNFGAANSSGEFFCFLNNDTQILEPNWLRNLIAHAVRPGVGIVGAKLTYPDGEIQHAGIAFGLKGIASHPYCGELERFRNEVETRGSCYEVSAVTFACSLVPAKVFWQLGGLPEDFKVGLNDVAYGLISLNAGFSAVLCGLAGVSHSESITRGHARASFSNFWTASKESVRFMKRYPKSQLIERYFSNQ